MVAHNGNLFDFPLLKAEMEKVSSTLGPAILLVDSYIGIKEIFKSRRDLKSNITNTPCSFSLKNLHKHFIGFYPSEADYLALLRTTSMLEKLTYYKVTDKVGIWGIACLTK